MRDIGEYLSEEETWRVGVKCQRENLMAEEATAMRSVIKRETPRKTRKVLLRATRINIGIVFPNLQDDIPFLQRNSLFTSFLLSFSLALSQFQLPSSFFSISIAAQTELDSTINSIAYTTYIKHRPAIPPSSYPRRLILVCLTDAICGLRIIENCERIQWRCKNN